MESAIKINWKAYGIEAWALGMFMISASCFVILFEHPSFHVNTLIPSAMVRRMCIGAAMGITAILLIYSKWGKQSGAHMNPAVTLANFQLNRISAIDAAAYILSQLSGASITMLLLRFVINSYLSAPSVNFIVTLPGNPGIAVAFLAEFAMAFCMFMMVLLVSNGKLAKYTGYFAGMLVFLFISFEAPLSGMSINPARSFGSAIAAGNWSFLWLYIISPMAGMQLAAALFRLQYFRVHGECKTMKCFMSGTRFNNKTYQVYSWWQRNEKGELVTVSASDEA